MNREQSPAALRRSERRYRALVQASSQVVWTFGVAGMPEETQVRWQQMTGQSAAESAGWGWLNALHPDDRDRIRSAWAASLENKLLFESEYRIRTPQGEYRHHAVRGVPLFDLAGELEEWVGIWTDITKNKQAEAALRDLNADLERRVAERTEAAEQRASALARSEAEVKRQTLVFESILNSIGEGVVVADETGQTVLLNRAAQELHGIGPHIPKEKWSEVYTLFLLDGQTPFPVEQLPLALALQGTATDDVEMVIRNPVHPAGVTMSVAGRPLQTEEGEAQGGVVVLRDISVRRANEAALRESQERFQSAFNYASIGMALVALEGRWLRVNRSLCEILGYSASELLATDFQTVTHPDDLDADLNFVRQLLAGAIQSYDMEKRYFHKRGHVIYVLLSVSLVRDAGGRPLYFVAQIQDISQRKRVEKELHDSEERHRLLVEGVGDYALYMLDPAGNVATWNLGAQRIKGYTAEEIIGRNFSVFYPALAVECGHPRQELEIARISGQYEEEGQRVRKDGTSFWAHVTITALHDESGQHVGFAKITRDVSNRKQAQAELERAKIAAEEANRSKSEFLANMSHEIRTPMNGILGMADLLLDTSLVAEQRDRVESVKESAESLLSIISDILDFSKIEAGKLELESTPFRLRALLDDLLKPLIGRARAKGLGLTCQICPQIPDALLGDCGRLRQVLVNLVGNAVKFTERGEIVVRVQTLPHPVAELKLHISVVDTGIGIPADRQHAIFAPFEQADGSTTRKYGGTGLGLSISARLVELLGGHIWVDSTVGQGSTFHFTVCLGVQDDHSPPVASMPHSVRDAVDGSQNETPYRRLLEILVVEDNPINQKVAAGVLRKEGHRVTVADNGRDAVTVLQLTTFDLVLMDVQMPQMNGLEATAEIRRSEQETGRHVPIIALTAHAMKGDRERFLAAGMDGYVSKPIRPEELRSAITACVPQERQRADVPLEEFSAGNLLDLVGGDRQLLAEIIALFDSRSATWLCELRDAIALGDSPRLAQAAHNLKGTLASMSASAAAASALKLEQFGALNRFDAAGEAYASLVEEMASLQSVLAGFRNAR